MAQLTAVDTHTKMKEATLVEKKGVWTYVVKFMSRLVARLGSTKVVLRGDAETSLMACLTKIQQELISRGIEVQLEKGANGQPPIHRSRGEGS